MSMRNAIALVLGGGRGTRLYPLTKFRSKPAVPLAGKYRLIDIPLSNCIHSGLHRIYVLTQFMSVSLHRHIRQSYRFDQFTGGFVEILAAQQTDLGGTDWYEGTADAVRKHLRYLEQPGIEHVVILSGDQLYRMDYGDLIKTHNDYGAVATIAAMPVTREAAKALGIMRVDDTGRVLGFLEKPQTHEEMDLVKMDPAWIDARGIPSQGRDLLASMGIYVFNRDALVDSLKKTDYRDFGKEVFPAVIRSQKVATHLFDGYWEDIGTVKAFFEANLSLTNRDAPFDFNEPDAPIYTRARFLPPTMMEGATVTNSLISDGCRIGKGAVIENCVVGLRSIIGENVTLRDCVIMGADIYEASMPGAVPLGIGDGSRIQGAILDKNCRIGRNVRIANEQKIENRGDEAMHGDDPCIIRDTIPVVVKDGTLPDGYVL
jgi:glucose-1-phosphate adenylyltransferase